MSQFMALLGQHAPAATMKPQQQQQRQRQQMLPGGMFTDQL